MEQQHLFVKAAGPILKSADADLRGWMREPFTAGEWNCATDGRLALIWKGPAIHRGSASEHSRNLILEWFGREQNIEPFTVTRAELDVVMEKWPMEDIPEVVECMDCNGDGEVECDECGHVNKCQECNGKGEIATGVTGGRRLSELGALDLMGHFHLGAATVPIIREILHILECDMTLIRAEKQAACIAELKDGFRLLIMPKWLSEVPAETIIPLKATATA